MNLLRESRALLAQLVNQAETGVLDAERFRNLTRRLSGNLAELELWAAEAPAFEPAAEPRPLSPEVVRVYGRLGVVEGGLLPLHPNAREA